MTPINKVIEAQISQLDEGGYTLDRDVVLSGKTIKRGTRLNVRFLTDGEGSVGGNVGTVGEHAVPPETRLRLKLIP